MRIRVETARLHLVPIDTRFNADLMRLFGDPFNAAWLFLTGPPTLEEIDKRTRFAEEFWQKNGFGMFAVLDKTNDAFVARVGAMPTPETGRIEIAWSTMREAHGKGYASEAAAAAIAFTFAHSRLEFLDCYLRPDNTASRRVAEKVGFQYQDTRWLYDRVLRYYRLPRP